MINDAVINVCITQSMPSQANLGTSDATLRKLLFDAGQPLSSSSALTREELAVVAVSCSLQCLLCLCA